jgi:hypothetical protein
VLRRTLIIGLAVAALAAALPAGAAPKARSARTFSGTCHFSGQVVFQPPLTATPQTIRQRVRLPGTCSGTLVDRRGRPHQLSDAPVTFVERSRGDNASCAGGTATGRGALRFQRGRIRFAFSETRTGGAAVASAQGARGGSAHGAASVSQSEDPVAIAQRCAGPGLERVTIDADFTTAPSISG